MKIPICFSRNSFIMRVSKFPAENEFVIDFVNDLKNRSVPKSK